MDVTKWYAVALGAIAALVLGFYLMQSVYKLVHTYATILFLKHLLYPQIHRRLRGSGRTSRFDVMLIMAFLIANMLLISIGVRSKAHIIQRTGLLSIINLIPLALGGRINLVANWCGITLGDYSRVHRWLGRVAITEGLVHSVVAAIFGPPHISRFSRGFGIAVSSTSKN